MNSDEYFAAKSDFERVFNERETIVKPAMKAWACAERTELFGNWWETCGVIFAMTFEEASDIASANCQGNYTLEEIPMTTGYHFIG